MEQTRKNTDTAFTISGRLLASCAVAYMVLPTILFLLGWVRPLFSVPAAMAVAAASVLLCVKLPVPTLHFTRRQLAVYLCALLLSLLWLLAGGITGVALQHADFVVRNPIYETLIRCDWPLAEADGRHFIYYLAFWLPPALICKCFSWSDVFIVNYVLTAWIELGLALALTVLWGKFRMATLLFLVLLIFQGPLDGVVRWSVHLFNPQGQTAHELYLTVLAGIYFTSSNGNNRIRLTWEDSPFDLLRHGGWKFWGALAGSWLLTVGAPAVLLFRRFKKDDLFWTALAVLTLTYFIYIGSVGGYNEFCYKASSVSFFCLALLFTRIFAEPVGTRPWRAWCVCYLALAALPSLSVFAKAAPTLAFTESARLANMQRLWEGHLHHPEHPWNAPLWGSGEGAAFRAAYFQKAGESADGPLRPFSTGMRTDAEPSAAPASRP